MWFRRSKHEKIDELSTLAAKNPLNGDGKQLLPKDLISSADLLALRQLQSAVEYFINVACLAIPTSENGATCSRMKIDCRVQDS